MIRVAVLGALGRMGREVCKAVGEDPATSLVAAVDPTGDGASVGGIPATDAIGDLRGAEVDVAVDFTHPDAVLGNVLWCVDEGVHAVVGTTGLSEAALDQIRGRIDEGGGRSNVLVVPNFALGAVLMMRFAAQAARYLPHAEIVELHHDGKADAPSGTALRTASEIARSRGPAPSPKVESTELVEGARGAQADGVRIHSVRLPGLVAHQEVHLAGPGEGLTIRHDSYDRASFMPGVLLAVKKVADHPGLTIGLDPLLEQ